MANIWARNVNDAWSSAWRLMEADGTEEPTRGGTVRVLGEPVMTTYASPRERVLMCPVRDANPMFHLMESLWMLAGWRDSRWLDLFVHDFSERYGEREGLMWGAYGDRWRNWFLQDQLRIIADRLSHNHHDRRSVLGMWDPGRDLNIPDADRYKDYPCNTHAYFRVRELPTNTKHPKHNAPYELDMTVCCRSNDIVWGAYGANAVHFSVLMEYMAARIGARMGKMYQLSNNWHMYTETAPKKRVPFVDSGSLNPYEDGSLYPDRIVDDPGSFDHEVKAWVQSPGPGPYSNKFLHETAWPVYRCGVMWRQACDNETRSAAERLDRLNDSIDQCQYIKSTDWRAATLAWLERRRSARGKRRGEAGPEAGGGGGEVPHVADAPKGDGC